MKNKDLRKIFDYSLQYCSNLNKFYFLHCVCDSLMKDYFYKPPINQLSLTFLDKSLESAYRISYQEEVCVCCF